MLCGHVKCFRLPPGAALLRDDLDRGATTTGGCLLTYSTGLALPIILFTDSALQPNWQSMRNSLVQCILIDGVTLFRSFCW